jgi:copper transport protein
MLRAFALLILTLLPLQALAHAQLSSADPAADALVVDMPDQVILRFNEPIAALQARLFAPDGEMIELDPQAHGANLILPMPETGQQGTYALSWRVVSDDGHPVGGTHLFSVGVVTDSAAPDDLSLPWFAAFARGVLTLALVMGVGGQLWAALSRDPAPWLVLAALWIVPPAAALLLAAQAMDLTGQGIAALADPDAWRLALASPFALTALAAVLAAALAIQKRRGAVLLAWFFAALSFALAGHAARAAPVPLMAALVFGHAVALIFWAGALPGLLLALRQGNTAPTMAMFSRIAIPMVVVLVLTGTALAWRQIGSIGAFVGSAYGWLLLAKLGFVGITLLLALRHRLVLLPALQRDPATACPVFRRSLRLELMVMLLILALTAGFRLTPPPRAMVETRVDLHLHGAQTMADIAVIPGRAGANRLEILPLDASFQPFTPREITLFVSRPADGLEQITVIATQDEDGIWRAGPVHLPTGGAFDLIADILITDFTKEMIGGELLLLP